MYESFCFKCPCLFRYLVQMTTGLAWVCSLIPLTMMVRRTILMLRWWWTMVPGRMTTKLMDRSKCWLVGFLVVIVDRNNFLNVCFLFDLCLRYASYFKDVKRLSEISHSRCTSRLNTWGMSSLYWCLMVCRLVHDMNSASVLRISFCRETVTLVRWFVHQIRLLPLRRLFRIAAVYF